jgi:hypothetical protein
MSLPLVSPSLQVMLQSVRNMLGQPDPNNSFWTDLELIEYLNEAIRIHFAELSKIDEGHFVTTTTLDFVSGTPTVALPTDHFQTKGLYRVVSQGKQLLEYRNNLRNDIVQDAGCSGDGYLPAYSFQGNNFLLNPVPNFSAEDGLYLEYIQFPEQVLNGSDVLTAQISPVFRQVVERYATYLAKLKESMTNGSVIPASLTQNLADVLQQFRDVISIRSKNPTYTQPFNP